MLHEATREALHPQATRRRVLSREGTRSPTLKHGLSQRALDIEVDGSLHEDSGLRDDTADSAESVGSAGRLAQAPTAWGWGGEPGLVDSSELAPTLDEPPPPPEPQFGPSAAQQLKDQMEQMRRLRAQRTAHIPLSMLSSQTGGGFAERDGVRARAAGEFD